jgi:O-antigen/teichoic acid export membrane protein
MSVIRRVVGGMGALAFGQAISIGIQLISLPLFLRYWNISQYGVWLVLSAIPSYFSMADVGMVTAAGNKMTMAMGRGDVVEANRIFQSALVFMLIACGALAVATVPTVLLLPLFKLQDLDQRVALCAMILGVLFSFFGGLSEAIFRATGRYGYGTTLANLTRLAELCGSIIGLMTFHTFSAVALGGLAFRMLGLFALIALSADGKYGIRWGFAGATRREVRAITRPALSFMLFPLTNALSFQGMTLLAGYELGPVLVVIFNTYRTIARIAVQAVNIFGFSLAPVFSLRFGQAGTKGITTMYRRAAALGIVLAVSLSVVLYFSGPLLLKTWTHGRVEFYSSLMFSMLVYAAVAGAWNVPRTLLTSTNEHTQMALWSTGISATSLALAAGLCRVWNLQGIVLAMLLSELMLALICARLVKRLASATDVGMTPHAA